MVVVMLWGAVLHVVVVEWRGVFPVVVVWGGIRLLLVACCACSGGSAVESGPACGSAVECDLPCGGDGVV